MRVLIAGGNGQLGRELAVTAPSGGELFCFDVDKLDIADMDATRKCLDEYSPDLIINAAAYTAVDRAEEDEKVAYAVNRDGAENLARAAREAAIPLLHVSTDFVFDGASGRPYLPEDTANPLGVYGASKQAGDERVLDILGDQAFILRTAWVYSAHGNNFVKTMLRLMGEKAQLGVVDDQIGTPTWARGLARALGAAAQRKVTGIHHWTDAGAASWYDFAAAIQEEALALGLLDRAIPIRPIRTEDYPTPARRPPNSLLEKSQTWEVLGLEPEHWRVALRRMLQELQDQ